MSRVMYDSVNPRSIPRDAKMVAGYIDGSVSRWPAEAWGWFPGAKMVRISAVGSTWDADVFDVEAGAIWPPSRVVPLVVEARKHGRNPTVYVNELNDWGPTREAFRRAGVAEPHWWVANYNGRPEVPAGSVGRQYANPSEPLGNPLNKPWHTKGHWDESLMADYWPGVDDEPTERNAEMTLMQGSGNAVYAVGAAGKRHIETEDELKAHKNEGHAVQSIPDAALARIPDVADWNTELPTEDSDTPAEFRPAHRLMAALYEDRHDGTTSVTLTETDRVDIANRVRLGLLEDLAPLFELAERLKD